MVSERETERKVSDTTKQDREAEWGKPLFSAVVQGLSLIHIYYR